MISGSNWLRSAGISSRVWIRSSGYPNTSYPFNPDIQLIYPDNIRISQILFGYPKLSGYPVKVSG